MIGRQFSRSMIPATILGMLVLAGCDSPVAVDVDPADVAVDFTSSVVLPNSANSIPFDVQGGVGQIVIDGFYLAGGGGWVLRGEFRRSGPGNYEFVVDATAGFGVAMPMYHRYTATISGLPPGNYALTVLHGHTSRSTLPLDKVFGGRIQVR